MKIHIHSVIYNEEVMLPYFLRHYEKFVDKIFLRIQPSTDNTLRIAKAHPKVVIVDYKTEYAGGKDYYNIMDLMEVRNNDWKNYSNSTNCDWVINVDCDEFLYHPSIINILEGYRKRGVTIPKTLGYQMYSETPPTTTGQIYDEIKKGFPSILYAKKVIIHPDIDPNYSPGSHQCVPRGDVVESEFADLMLLHYSKVIFGKQALIDLWLSRLARNRGRIDKKYKDLTKEELKELQNKKINVNDFLLDGIYYLYKSMINNFSQEVVR